MSKRSVDLKKIITAAIKRAQSDGKVFETRKIEFKRGYSLMNSSGKINKAVQAELIRDVISLANSLPDPELEIGLLILGVKDNGNIIDNYTLPVSDVSILDSIINGPLDRAVTFHYEEYVILEEKIGVIIIPRSSAKPHIVKTSIQENDTTHLKAGECWTRGPGGKKLAMATDFDEMYEQESGINKFETSQSNKKLKVSVKKSKTSTQAEKVERVLGLDNENLNETIKKLLK